MCEEEVGVSAETESMANMLQCESTYQVGLTTFALGKQLANQVNSGQTTKSACKPVCLIMHLVGIMCPQAHAYIPPGHVITYT